MAPPNPPGSSPPYKNPQDLRELLEGSSKLLELSTSLLLARTISGTRFTFNLTINPILLDELAVPFSQPNSTSTA
jgi:hypothetical protein